MYLLTESGTNPVIPKKHSPLASPMSLESIRYAVLGTVKYIGSEVELGLPILNWKFLSKVI